MLRELRFLRLLEAPLSLSLCVCKTDAKWSLLPTLEPSIANLKLDTLS